MFHVGGNGWNTPLRGGWGCVMEPPSVFSSTEAPLILVSGRAVAVIAGSGGRFGPEVRYVELAQPQTGER